MGMDVYGRKPKNKTGEYFRANIWSWKTMVSFGKVQSKNWRNHDPIFYKKLLGLRSRFYP